MSAESKIEWTDATWNPVRGCLRVSEGCRNCYAEIVAARLSGPGQPYEGFANRDNPKSKWTGKVALIESALTLPLNWKKPKRIFVNSMSDLFHESLPDEAIDKVFAVMALAPQHTFQILTKRPERMMAYLSALRTLSGVADAVQPMRKDNRAVGPLPHLDGGERWWPLSNVWLGVSVEDQAAADSRIPHLLATPAAVRFLSCEPLLGPLHLRNFLVRGDDCLRHVDPMAAALLAMGEENGSAWVRQAIDWVIVGGESGRHVRPMHPDWARSLRDQCAAAGVPLFFKQWGSWAWASDDKSFDDAARHARIVFGPNVKIEHDSDGNTRARVGKARAGRLLDGREHNEFPHVIASEALRA